jgi:phage head maturation protease
MVLDGQALEGASYQMTYGSVGAARNSFNQLFKHDYTDYGFQSAQELRKYLEDKGRLIYQTLEL